MDPSATYLACFGHFASLVPLQGSMKLEMYLKPLKKNGLVDWLKNLCVVGLQLARLSRKLGKHPNLIPCMCRLKCYMR